MYSNTLCSFYSPHTFGNSLLTFINFAAQHIKTKLYKHENTIRIPMFLLNSCNSITVAPKDMKLCLEKIQSKLGTPPQLLMCYPSSEYKHSDIIIPLALCHYITLCETALLVMPQCNIQTSDHDQYPAPCDCYIYMRYAIAEWALSSNGAGLGPEEPSV